jgi:hypothetical protein
LKEISNHVKNHSGIALGLEDNFTSGAANFSKIKLNDTQENQIKKFKEAGWKMDKISSIKTAFRIINAEDSGKASEAKQIMDSAFTGRKRIMNRKMYNLARAGYMDRFALDLFFSTRYNGDESISNILENFPEAIFLDQDFMVYDLESEFIEREKDGIPQVSVYARGKRRVEVIEKGYMGYLNNKKEAIEGKHDTKIKVYMITQKMPYKICDNESMTIDLMLSELPEKK